MAFIWTAYFMGAHPCFLFHPFIRYGHLSNSYMQSVMLPLVKNKCVDLTDRNNCRAIASSSALSKILESVICAHLYMTLNVISPSVVCSW